MIPRSGKTSLVSYALDSGHHTRHKWYYYPNMTKSEVLLFMQYASDFKSHSRYTFHSSVRDPSAPPNYVRQSIELRTIAFFPDHPFDTIPSTFLTSDKLVRNAVAMVYSSIEHLDHWPDQARRRVISLLAVPGGARMVARGMLENHAGRGLNAEQIETALRQVLDGDFERNLRENFL